MLCDFHMFVFVVDMLLRVFSNLKTINLKAYIYFMSSKKKRQRPCPFASAKKPSKRKKGLNSFDKDQADVLAASERGSYFEQDKLIALDEEEQKLDRRMRLLVLAGRKLKAKAKTNPQIRTQKAKS